MHAESVVEIQTFIAVYFLFQFPIVFFLCPFPFFSLPPIIVIDGL